MRSVIALAVVVVALAAPTAARAESLRLEHALLDGVVDTLLSRQDADGAFLTLLPALPLAPVLGVMAAQTSHPAPAGRTLPPQLSGVGLGLQVGSPTSLTLKIGGVQENGFVIGLGSGFAYSGVFAPNLSLHVDYLFHVATLVRNADVALTAYVGPGLWLALGSYGYGFGLHRGVYSVVPFGLGVRVPLGLSMSFTAAPKVEVYLELDPALFVFPPADFGVGASVGFRWHF